MGSIVVGKIISIRDHPRADRIWIADVDVGTGKYQIIWGGLPILQSGMLVPVALPGTVVGSKVIRTRYYRGERSEAMLCSREELGWPPDSIDQVAVLTSGKPGDEVVPDEHDTSRPGR